MKFRKKPVVIEAVHFISQPTEIEGTEPAWYREARTIDRTDKGSIAYNTIGGTRPHLIIHTLEGMMIADVGDWIIRGVKGEVYPIKADILAETYEAVDAPSPDTLRPVLSDQPANPGAHAYLEGPLLPGAVSGQESGR